MTSNTALIVDLQRPNIAVVAYGVQGDSLSRKLTLTLIDGDKPWTPPAGALPVVRYGKPDGTFGFYDTLEDGSPAISITGNTATVTLAAQALTAPGNVAMQLNFFTADEVRLSSFAWILRVDPAAVEDGKIESTEYISTLTEAMATAIELLPEIEKAGEYAKTASDAAAAAEQSKTAAAGSASAAAGSATAAGAAAQSASASQQAASASATAAGQAATSADASKAAAAESATDAAQSEAAAEDSAEDAEAWAVGQRNGEDVPATDPTHNNNAKYWAEQAKTAAGGGVLSINGKTPDDAGAVDLTAADVGAASKADMQVYFTPFADDSPAARFGGTWTQIKDRFILAAGDAYAAGSTGGEATHMLTIAELAAHNHMVDIRIDGGSNYNYWSIKGDSYYQNSPEQNSVYMGNTNVVGNGQPHNNMPPYLSLYIWMRVTEEVAA